MEDTTQKLLSWHLALFCQSKLSWELLWSSFFYSSIDFSPKCQPFPLNHIFSGCQLLKKIWEVALNTTVTCKIPEARHDQALVPQTCSMEWQLCCLRHLLRTEKEKKKKKEKKKCTQRVACHKKAKLSSTNRTENSILQNQKSLLENKTHGWKQAVSRLSQLGGELSSTTDWNYLHIRWTKAILCLVKETGAWKNTQGKIFQKT